MILVSSEIGTVGYAGIQKFKCGDSEVKAINLDDTRFLGGRDSRVRRDIIVKNFGCYN